MEGHARDLAWSPVIWLPVVPEHLISCLIPHTVCVPTTRGHFLFLKHAMHFQCVHIFALAVLLPRNALLAACLPGELVMLKDDQKTPLLLPPQAEISISLPIRILSLRVVMIASGVCSLVNSGRESPPFLIWPSPRSVFGTLLRNERVSE